MKHRNNEPREDEPDVGRRDFFREFFREAILRPVAEFRAAARGDEEEEAEEPTEAVVRSGQPLLRPPSVANEEAFLERCERTGECVRACPANAIFSSLEDGTPYIDPTNQPCVICTELACMAACPSGALTPRPAYALDMGVAKVTHEICLRSQGVDCRLCIESCPLHDLGRTVLDLTLEGQVHVAEDVCVGCGCCVRACPSEPRAMQVVPTRISLPTGRG